MTKKMDKYYKTNRDSKTGLKLKAILDKADEFDNLYQRLKEKYGFVGSYKSSLYYKAVAAVTFNEEPDMTLWKMVRDTKDGYYPRARCKNKQLLADFEELEKLKIYRRELDSVVGINYFFYHAGFDFDVPDIYIFIVENDWNCDIPDDCQEISNIEYEQLMKEAENVH